MRTTRFLKPGVLVMQRLSMRVKLLCLAALLALPLVVVLGLECGQLYTQYRWVAREIVGVRAVLGISDLVSLVQTHRGQTNLVLSGQTAVVAQRQHTREQLAQSVDRLDTDLRLASDLGLADGWSTAHQSVLQLVRDDAGTDRAQVFARHTHIIEALRQLALFAAETSGLLLDSQAHTAYLMDVFTQRTLIWTEHMGVLRGAGAGLLARTDASALEVASVLARSGELTATTRHIADRLATLRRSGEPPPPS